MLNPHHLEIARIIHKGGAPLKMLQDSNDRSIYQNISNMRKAGYLGKGLPLRLTDKGRQELNITLCFINLCRAMRQE